MGKLKKTAELGVGAGGAISTVCGLVADFFMPVAPYGIYLGFAGLLLLLISIVLFFTPFTNKRLAVAMNDSWYLPSFVLLLVFTTSMFGFYYFGKSVQGGSGYLAGSFEELSHLQSQILATNLQIEANTRETASNTKRTSENTDALTRLVKRETSGDPRKELGNLGWSWSQNSFYDAVLTNNDVVVDLFLQGGMSLNSTDYYSNNLVALISSPRSHTQLIKLLRANSIEKNTINSLSSSVAVIENTVLSRQLESYYPSMDYNNLNKPFANQMQMTPLITAIFMNNSELAELLIRKGASTETYCSAYDVNNPNSCLLHTNPVQEARKKGILLN
ncbi:hypothetical protein GCM10025856_21040 [Methylophaga marina]|uniref:Ankyrin repeat domain-containing protein n=2 Tax=Methylophaga marina TaxID=45495 RepID=A0ABP3DCZ1_9GAMM|nr:hypothetical protein GCM10025856_21040 [Methylophaga marina]